MSMRKVYRTIARKNKISVAEVKREMQTAIDYAYEHTPDDGITGAYQNQVPRKGEVPTTDELIRHMARKAGEKMQA